jgi:ABC-type branched-subunit amino acid transport system substrate-binding protein
VQNVALPLTGDDAAIKKYAQEVEALKRKVGMPDFEDLINAELDYKFACAGYDVKKFVAAALEEMDLGESLQPAVKEVLAAVEAAEKASGKPLDSSNDKGWAAVTAKIGEIEKKYGMADKKAVRDEAVFDTYKKHIHSLRAQVTEDVGKVQTAEALEHIQPNLGKLKPKLT